MDNKKITIDDVAKALNVSKTTVSRAISGKGRVGAATRERILSYIEEHNYVPSAMAKGLAQSTTYNIGITMPEDFALVDLPFFQKCLTGVCEKASENDMDVLISTVGISDVSRLEKLVKNRKVDGVILTRTLTDDPAEEFLSHSGLKFVTIGTGKKNKVVRVDNDHEAACEELTGNLIKQGTKKFALMCGNSLHVVTKNRMKGFLNAVEAAAIPAKDAVIFEDVLDKDIDAIVEKIVGSDTECILCMDDAICIKVIDSLKKRGLKVPKDIKVASFYNSTVLERNTPSVTSLSFDATELGRVACETLIKLIKEEIVPAKTLLTYEVLMKESTESAK